MIKNIKNAGILIIMSLFLVTGTCFADYFEAGFMGGDNINISYMWKFQRGDVKGAQQPGYDDSAWEDIGLPHCLEYTCHTSTRYYRGVGWYRKGLDRSLIKSNKNTFIVFEAAMSKADVWINGNHLGQHLDGSTPFVYNLTPYIKGREKNVLAVKVDNSHDPDIPPGTEIPDYNLYGGIYRDVHLVFKNDTYIKGLTITTPELNHDRGTVRVLSDIVNTGAAGEYTVRFSILDNERQVVSQGEVRKAIPGGREVVAELMGEVLNPELWSPENPYLYRLKVELYKNGRLLDSTAEPLGFRWFKFIPGQGFFLNGEHYVIYGANRHQTFPWLCSAVPDRFNVEDVRLFKDMGCNFLRCSHYVQDSALLDACDEQGLLVWDEVLTWGYFTHEYSDKFWDNLNNSVIEMIKRDRNHPCVILWSMFNEPVRDYNAPGQIPRMVATAHELDSTRPTTAAMPGDTHGLSISKIIDVMGWNIYADIYSSIRKWWYIDRNVLVSECHKEYSTYFDLKSLPWMSGQSFWCMFDHSTLLWYNLGLYTKNGLTTPGTCNVFRIPKDMYYFYRTQWKKGPQIHITGHWTHHGKKGRKKVKVYSNCDSVELYHNGKFIGRKSSSRGIYRWKVRYSPGELKAVGIDNGSEAVAHALVTAGEPHSVRLESDVAEVMGNGSDIAVLTASIVDSDGNVVPTDKRKISFSLEGSGELMGYSTLKVSNGVCRIYYKAPLTGPAASGIKAESGGLQPAETVIAVREYK